MKACVSRVLAFLALIIACGCSDDGLGRRYPISGAVTYNGQPLARGTINFIPVTAEGHGATGPIDQGAYSEVTTLTSGDGILPGDYFVTVTALSDVDLSGVEREAVGGSFDQVSVSQALSKAKPLIPLKYSNVSTSGLKVTVEPKSTTFDVTLSD